MPSFPLLIILALNGILLSRPLTKTEYMTDKPANPKGKTCSKCKEEKSISEFSKHNSRKDLLQRYCRPCVKLYNAANKEERSAASRQWRKENKEKLLDYRTKNKEKLKVYFRVRAKEKYHNDPMFRLKGIVRKSIWKGLSSINSRKNKRTHEILGCSLDYFSTYIENQFKEGMTFSNIHLDHIVPLSLGETEEEIIALNHYSNFQPLFKTDNIRKSNKLILDIISPENKIRYKEIIERAQKC